MSTRSSSKSTLQAERVAKLRMEIRREHDAIAALRAEWAKLDNPARIQALAQRHLTLKPVDAAAIRQARPPAGAAARARARGRADPIGTVIADPQVIDRSTTGSVPPAQR